MGVRGSLERGSRSELLYFFCAIIYHFGVGAHISSLRSMRATQSRVITYFSLIYCGRQGSTPAVAQLPPSKVFSSSDRSDHRHIGERLYISIHIHPASTYLPICLSIYRHSCFYIYLASRRARSWRKPPSNFGSSGSKYAWRRQGTLLLFFCRIIFFV